MPSPTIITDINIKDLVNNKKEEKNTEEEEKHT